MSIKHFDGWQKTLAPGWHLRRVGPTYRLLHGRSSLGEVEDVQIRGRDGPSSLCVMLASGILLAFPIREPKTPKEERE